MAIAIVGGGITGLAAAHRLQQDGVAVTLLETSSHPGGKVRTERIGPYTIECGADSFVASRPRIIDLCRELGIESDLIAPPRVVHAAYIRHRGQRYPMPAGFTGLVPTKLMPTFRSRLLTPAGKARLALEPAIPTERGIQDESLEHFVIRRFGREAYIRLFEPLLTGISSSDGNHVSLEASFPAWKTAELEYGSVIRGLLRQQRASQDTPRLTGFRSFTQGLQHLPDALTAAIREAGGEIRLNAAVESITRTTDGYRLIVNGTVLDVAGLIVATPAPVAATLLRDLDTGIADILGSIPQRTAIAVTMAYEDRGVDARLEGFGYLNTRENDGIANGATFVHRKWAHRAPEGHALIRVFLGRRSQEDIVQADDGRLIDIAREEIASSMRVTAAPVATHVSRWVDSQPQLAIGHLTQMDRLSDLLASHRGLALAGNYVGGVGIPLCIQSGERAGDRMRQHLRDAV